MDFTDQEKGEKGALVKLDKTKLPENLTLNG